MSAPTDVAIIGGGIVGCAAAAFLAEAGARVDLYERDEVAAAASGRNSGSVQHPFDPVLRDLHVETLRHYRELDGFELPAEPAGVLMLARERAVLEPSVHEVARECPELAPALLGPEELRAWSPRWGPGSGAAGSDGLPGAPRRGDARVRQARPRAGARFHEGETAWPWVIAGRARGVLPPVCDARPAPCSWPRARGRPR